MRGKGYGIRLDNDIQRITPAHAGKSHTPDSPPRAAADHPRACGEKIVFGADLRHDLGSPPRMRGKAHAVLPFLTVGRITPAHAGKSSQPCCR